MLGFCLVCWGFVLYALVWALSSISMCPHPSVSRPPPGPTAAAAVALTVLAPQAPGGPTAAAAAVYAFQ